MIITIDGPTASGKSTAARLLAEQTGSFYINSGLIFRGVAYLSMKEQIPLNLTDLETLEKIVTKKLSYQYTQNIGPTILYHNEPITQLLTSAEIDSQASIIAINPSVRQIILDYQRTLAHNRSVVADGRDCGTVVFPDANFKFFITARLEIRAYRWRQAQLHLGNKYSLEEATELINKRDTRDTQRPIAPLKAASDSLIIDNSEMTVQQTVEAMLVIVQ